MKKKDPQQLAWLLQKMERRNRLLAESSGRDGGGEGSTTWKHGLGLAEVYLKRIDRELTEAPWRERQVNFPERFSILENPDETLSCIEDLVECLASPRTRRIHLNQAGCLLIDHEAESIVQSLAINRRRHRYISYSGSFPESAEQHEIVSATGLPRKLRVKGLPPARGFLSYPLRFGCAGKESALRSSPREVETDRLSTYVDRCLRVYGYSLTRSQLELLASLVGEVLSNAEEHSGMHSWWAAAYLRQSEEVGYGDCHITLFNYGATIAETLQNLPEDSMLAREMRRLSAAHTRFRLLYPPKWTRDDLLTVYALQQGVSCLNTQVSELGTRGHGTVRMIRFFQEIGATRRGDVAPKMCLLSGNTWILFDGRYRMSRVRDGASEERWRIAFNADNDLEKPPDASVVRHLDHFFPGTVLSLRFYLDPDHLAQVAGSGNDH